MFASLSYCFASISQCKVCVEELSRVTIDDHWEHDPFTLRGVDHLGHDNITMGFGVPKVGSTLVSSTSPPPPSRLNIVGAMHFWMQFWTGKLSLGELFDAMNTRSIAMVLPRTP